MIKGYVSLSLSINILVSDVCHIVITVVVGNITIYIGITQNDDRILKIFITRHIKISLLSLTTELRSSKNKISY